MTCACVRKFIIGVAVAIAQVRNVEALAEGSGDEDGEERRDSNKIKETVSGIDCMWVGN